jgi:hypothetical protein
MLLASLQMAASKDYIRSWWDEAFQLRAQIQRNTEKIRVFKVDLDPPPEDWSSGYKVRCYWSPEILEEMRNFHETVPPDYSLRDSIREILVARIGGPEGGKPHQ